MKRSNNLFGAALILFSLSPIQSPAALPEGKAAAESPETGGHAPHRRDQQVFMLVNGEGAMVKLWKPDLTVMPLAVEHGGITLPRTGVDNYHALVVERNWGDLREAIIRYQYMHGKPGGHSTRELTAARKTIFEIVPDPVPREHQHYRADETWRFHLRLWGAAAAGVPVRIETSHGSRIDTVSDNNGRISVRIPDDFPDVQKGDRDLRHAQLNIRAELTDAGITYQTLLNADYRANPAHWQSFGLGAAVTGAGMLAGVFLGRIGHSDRGGKKR